MEEQQKDTVAIDTLNPQQLQTIKKQLEDDIVVLVQSLEQFKSAYSRYEDSKHVLKAFGDKGMKNKETLIPITSSLYIQGTIVDNENVLVDYGTGYYVERTVDQGVGYCERKGLLIKENMEKIANVVNQKKKAADQISLVLQKKIQAYQAQVAAQK
jgi:prefoldin alpha subunit